MSKFRSRAPRMLVAALVALQPLAVLACDIPAGVTVSQADAERMDGFLHSRAQGLGEALVADSASDRGMVSALFGRPDTAPVSLPDGEYRCRTIKLGGILPLTAYGYFSCRVSGQGTRIDKLSGSQRFSGTLHATGGAVFYRGALHYGDEKPMAYGKDDERNQVGCIYRVPDDQIRRYRLELPSPLFESTHDVIELVPIN
jgi:hypothetical protein